MKKRTVVPAIESMGLTVEQFLEKHYYPENCNLSTAAKVLNLNKKALWAFMKNKGFATKSQSESQSGKLNQFYGKKHNNTSKKFIGVSSKARQTYLERGKYGRYGSDTFHPSGKDNPFWQTGIAAYRKYALSNLEPVCNCCGEKDVKRLHVHHIDKNRYNNSIDNLKILCVKCHNIEHGCWKNLSAKKSLRFS